jgi:acetolactate synthase-1/3 small subunit
MENEVGSLSHIIGLFAQRALNIESLTAVPAIDNNQALVTQVTLNTTADARTMALIAKQINKQIDVLKVTVLALE